MCGHTRFDRIKNAMIIGKIGVISIEEMIREARLR